MGSKLKHVITLRFKCKLSVENSRPIFSLPTQQKSLWCLDKSTNHLGLNTFQLPGILTTNVSPGLGKTYTLGYYLTTYLLKCLPEN